MTTSPTESSDPRVERLLREGIAAARAGDKQTARAKLREVVALDQNNERGWFWLASVAETLEERRTCLGNVIVINPNNEKAKQMLERISFSAVSPPYSQSDAAQHKERDALIRTAVIVGLGVVGALALLIFLLGSDSEPPLPTVAAIATATPDDSLRTATALAAAAFITQTANAEGTRLARQLPPTWTPLPSPTLRGGPSPTPLPSPPFALAGRLIVQYGTPLTRDGYLPLFLYDLATGQMTPLTGRERGDYGRFIPDGRRFAYARLVSGARPQLLLRIANLNGSQPQELSSFWRNQPPLADQAMLSVARNGEGLVFVARNVTAENDPTSDVYHLPLSFVRRAAEPTPVIAPGVSPTPEPTAAPLQVRRVTARESGVNTWAALSPDGSQIAFVSDRTDIGGDGHDIYVVPVNETFAPERALTSDGDAMIESGLQWSPDGWQLLFSAGAPNSARADLFLINADGSGRRTLVEDFGECIRPVWSPDGQYVVFSSKRSGKWELYVVVVESGEIYQLSQTTEDVIIATDWSE
ncbi:MAG: PD40 domain-containing protein [Chloroflexi bacterium]|nr:PD40 domain-containing protein [Chloroflexota bacterium]